MSKRSDPSAFARAAGASDPANAGRAPSPDPAPPLPESATALARPLLLVEEDEDEPDPIPYDPAEYRWVPVRRKPRLDGWTEEKQRRFIEALADTGLVNVAARTVGMSRESAYQLRRSAHGGPFARAWDAARQHAAGLIEDIAFERAIEGTEQEVLDYDGNVRQSRLVHDNRLLQFLLTHLKPERYGSDRARAASREAADPPPDPDPVPVLAECLRAMEPALPAPPEALLDPDTFADELEIADIADGALPHFLSEQRAPKTEARLQAEEAAARDARGAAALEKRQAGGVLTPEEGADECYHLDPASNQQPRPRRRQGT